MAAMLGLARVYGAFPGDEWALLELRQWRTDWLDVGALILTGIGSGGIPSPWIPVVAVVGLLGLRRWGDALFLSAAVLAPAVNLGLKELAARPRPDAALALIEEMGYAFP